MKIRPDAVKIPQHWGASHFPTGRTPTPSNADTGPYAYIYTKIDGISDLFFSPHSEPTRHISNSRNLTFLLVTDWISNMF